jgi:hypothetical protein
VKGMRKMIKDKIKILIIMIKCIFHIDGWEWFSPEIREMIILNEMIFRDEERKDQDESH